MKLIVLILVMFLVAACTDEPLLNPSHSPVKLHGNGEFIYDFKRSEDCAVVGIEQCAINSMQKRNLMPSSCNNIKVLKGGYGEGGWAWATFRCES